MPTARAIRVRDAVSPRLAILSTNIQIALSDGVTETLAISTRKIRGKVVSSVTKTGKMRVAGVKPRFKVRPAWYLGNGPGRVESGRLLASARFTVNENQGKVTGRGGFINAPRYTDIQENGDGKIPPMMAYQLGVTTFEARFAPTMTRKLNSGIRLAQLGRQSKRSAVGYE